MTLRVQHISFSRSGGAGTVAKYLAESQISLGIDARLDSLTEGTLVEDPLRNSRTTFAAGFDEYFLKNGNFDSPISLIRSKLSSPIIDKHADIIHLHWIEGVVSLPQLSEAVQRGQKIVWTLHDMKPFTGACHYSGKCRNFESTCQRCPAVRLPARKIVESARTKMSDEFGITYDNIQFCSPSYWLADLAKSSGLVTSKNMNVIKNPINSSFFEKAFPEDRTVNREGLIYVLMAGNLSDPRKNIAETIQKWLLGSHPEDELILIGANGNGFSGADKRIKWLGKVTNDEVLNILDSADCLLSCSKSDNSPLVIVEAGSRGLCTIVLEVGGSAELVDASETGLVVRELEALPSAMETLRELGPQGRKQMGKKAILLSRQQHLPVNVAAAYRDLYLGIA